MKSVKFPDGFAANLRKNIVDRNSKVVGLKSHDCHVIMQRILPIAIRLFMEKYIVETITELSNFFQLICSRKLNVNDLKKVEQNVVLILCKLKTIFPLAFFDNIVHLIMHLPKEAIRGDLVHLK